MSKYILLLILTAIIIVASCDDMNDPHKEYLREGEIVYIGKLDSVKVLPGNKRVKLIGLLNADPKISYCRIYWGNRSDSVDVKIDGTSDNEDRWFEQLLSLDEGGYTFEFVNHDDDDNTSLSVSKTGEVYGDEYESGLISRKIDEIVTYPDSAIITWKSTIENSIGVDFTYINKNDETISVFVETDQDELILKDFKVGGQYEYQTLFLPEEEAIDTFYSAKVTGVFPSEFYLDRSKWLKVILPTDAPLGCYGGSIENLWDGDKGTWYHSGCTEADGIPHHFTIDLGTLSVLSKFKVSPRQNCCQERNPKRFQIWGIADLEGAETTAAPDDPNWADDAIAKGWTLLADVETDPSWNGSAEDYEVEIPENIAVKYIRFRFLEAYSGGQETALSEFVFCASKIY